MQRKSVTWNIVCSVFGTIPFITGKKECVFPNRTWSDIFPPFPPHQTQRNMVSTKPLVPQQRYMKDE